jgi:hypothetical protein
VDAFVAYQAPGAPFSSVADETLIRHDGSTYDNNAWTSVGSVVPDPFQPASVWHTVPANDPGIRSAAVISRLRAGLTETPGGDAVIGLGSGWSNSPNVGLRFTPSATSPILWVRMSASPTTEATPGGPRLVAGVEQPSGPFGIIDTSSAALGGTGGEGPHSVYIQWRTGDGTWSTPIQRIVSVDMTVPVVGPPVSRFAVGGTVGTGAPVRTTWTVSDALSGVGGVGVNRFFSGGPSKSWSFQVPPWTSLLESVPLGKNYKYDVNAYDIANNGGGGRYGPWVRPLAYQGTSSAIVNYKTWSTQTSSVYLGGSTRYATAAGSRATFTFSGRAVAIVSTKARTRGKAEVWVDGVKKATIDMYSSTTRYRQVVWETSWTTVGTHTVQFRVLGTSGRPRVDVDAFLKF